MKSIFYRGGFYPTVKELVDPQLAYLNSGITSEDYNVWFGSLPIEVYEKSKVDLPNGISVDMDEKYVYFKRFLTNKDREYKPMPEIPNHPRCRCN